MRKISMRSSREGKSTKNISSKRPLRINSGGRRVTLLAVAMTNTGDDFSCSHVTKLFRGMIKFQNARLANDRFFFRQDHVDVEAPLLYQRFGKDILRLVNGQPQGRLGNALTQRRALPDL